MFFTCYLRRNFQDNFCRSLIKWLWDSLTIENIYLSFIVILVSCKIKFVLQNLSNAPNLYQVCFVESIFKQDSKKKLWFLLRLIFYIMVQGMYYICVFITKLANQTVKNTYHSRKIIFFQIKLCPFFLSAKTIEDRSRSMPFCVI